MCTYSPNSFVSLYHPISRLIPVVLPYTSPVAALPPTAPGTVEHALLAQHGAEHPGNRGDSCLDGYGDDQLTYVHHFPKSMSYNSIKV